MQERALGKAQYIQVLTSVLEQDEPHYNFFSC